MATVTIVFRKGKISRKGKTLSISASLKTGK
jgi:hypothetical protein